MTSRQIKLRAITVGGIVGIIAPAIAATPEVITQVLVGASAVLAASFALMILSFTPWLQSAPPERQGPRIWWTASGAVLMVCIFYWVNWAPGFFYIFNS